jgi:hypothetical protein
MQPTRDASRLYPAGTQTVHWVIAVVLAAIAGALWVRPAGGLLPAASAQNQRLAGARGVYAFTGQLDQSRHGLFMLDVDSADGTRKLRLVAARSWVYDRYLQDFNCASPDFRMVQRLVAQQRAAEPGSGPIPGRGAEDEDNKPPGPHTGSERDR